MAEEQNTDQTGTPSPEDQNSSQAFATLLESIKDGERQKYASVEDALKSIPNAQDHIKSLEEKNRELEEKLKEAKAVDDLMAKLEEKATSQANQPQGEQVFDEGKLDEVLTAKLAQREQQSKAQANVAKVIDTLTEKYGDKAEAVYEKLAVDAGVGVSFLNEMSAKSPAAVLKLAGVTEVAPQKQPGKIDTSIRSEALQKSNEEKSSRVKMVGASSDDLVQAWRNTAPQ